MADTADFVLRLIDKVTGPADRIAGGLDGLSGAFSKLDGAAGKTSKLTKALEAMTLAVRGLQIVQGALEISKLIGGLEGAKALFRRVGAGLQNFGRGVVAAGRKLAPFAVGGAGLFGLVKLGGAMMPVIGGISLALGGIAIAAGLAGAAIGLLGFKLTSSLGQAGLAAARFRETSELALGRLRNGNGAAEFDRIKKTAIDMGTPLAETVHQFQKLAAMQFSTSDADMFFKRMIDLRSVGASAEQTGRAMLAITQIKSAGKLQGDELNQLAEAGVSVQLVLEELAKTTGKTVPEIVKMKEAGKITADMALTAIERAIGKKTGAATAGAAGKAFMDNTFDGMLERIRNMKGILLDDLAQVFMPAFKGLMPILKDVLGGLKGESAQGFIAGLGNAFTVVLEGARAAWPFVKQFLSGFQQGFGDSLAALQQIGTSIRSAFSGENAMSAEQIGALAMKIGENFGRAAVAAGVFMAQMMTVTAAVAGFFGVITSGIGDMFGRGVALVQGLIDGIRSMLGFLTTAAHEIANAIMNPLQTVFRFGSPSHTMIDRGADIGEGKAIGMESKIPRIAGASGAMAGAALGSSGGGGGPRGDVNITLQVTAAPGATREDGQRFGEGLRPVIRREVMAIFAGEALGAAF